ncbi:MAG: hypothetical protein GWN93_25900 [Deltaproteobacteria bacterium]|nr:hypothetical protein [Deltaproteobacteria bacterium]
MMLRKKTLLRVLCVFAIVSLLGAVPLFAATEEVEIIGTVFGTAWDSNDNATAVIIATEDGEEIAVSNSGKGMELLKLEEKNVKAMGFIAQDEGGMKTITVTKYVLQE